MDSKPGIIYATLMPGGRKQTLEIENLRFLNYGADFDMAKLPRPRLEYPGRSPDAPWRKAALERIEKIRTTPIHVEVVDAAGKSLVGAKVRVELKRHAFGFGAAVKAKFLMGPDAGGDRFAALVPKLEITEFEINTHGDEELQADWLRDCLIMAYSHPAYRAFILWIFWEGTGYKPEVALWRTDWSEKPNAKVWRELVDEQWRTKATGVMDAEGTFHTRGHRGLYNISVGVDGRKASHRFNTKDGSSMLRVVF